MTRKKMRFHVSQILDVTTGFLVSHPLDFSGLGEILCFMSGEEELGAVQYGRVADECKTHLLQQFPSLNSPEMVAALATLLREREAFNSTQPAGSWAPGGIEALGAINALLVSKIADGTYGVQLPLCEPPTSEEIASRPDLSLLVIGTSGFPPSFKGPVSTRFLEVTALPLHVHERIDHDSELLEKTSPDKIVWVDLKH